MAKMCVNKIKERKEKDSQSVFICGALGVGAFNNLTGPFLLLIYLLTHINLHVQLIWKQSYTKFLIFIKPIYEKLSFYLGGGGPYIQSSYKNMYILCTKGNA